MYKLFFFYYFFTSCLETSHCSFQKTSHYSFQKRSHCSFQSRCLGYSCLGSERFECAMPQPFHPVAHTMEHAPSFQAKVMQPGLTMDSSTRGLDSGCFGHAMPQPFHPVAHTMEHALSCLDSAHCCCCSTPCFVRLGILNISSQFFLSFSFRFFWFLTVDSNQQISLTHSCASLIHTSVLVEHQGSVDDHSV